MNDSNPFARESDDDRDPRADTLQPLPPVEPPSAGFIVQLFVIPAVIVAAVVGIYLLFGRLATGELDWRQQVDNVRSQNPHVKWPGALSLAQMLDADAAAGQSAQPLAKNPEIAAALSELFVETRGLTPRSEETTAQVEFLAKALGRLDVPDVVFPVLLDAAESDADRELRKHALTAVAMSAGRAFERGVPYDNQGDLTQRVLQLSANDDPLVRHQAAFILGLVDSQPAHSRLELLTVDADQMTRANAAIGLARQGSTTGWPVFEEVLADAVANPLRPQDVANDEQAQLYFERQLLVTNSIRAVDLLAPQLAAADRRRTARLLEQVADATGDAQLSLSARDLSLRLSAE